MTLRPASPEDRDWLLALVRDERVAASLSPRAAESLEDALSNGGALVVEDDGERAGVACWSERNPRNRIAGVHTVAIVPHRQRRGLAVAVLRELVRLLVDEYGFHRVEAETYGFNAGARRAFGAAGFTEEGIRRRAWHRHGDWQDGVHFGLLADD